ncbi:MAG: TrmH family RNA methyltransferase, partial [Terriglobales bacterium]
MTAATDRVAGIHAVREALRARSRPIQYLALSQTRQDARLQELERLARAAGVPLRRLPAAALERLAGSPRHQGAVAVLAAKALLELAELLALAPPPGLLLALDGIQDPHNLGAILRSAAGAGAHGVILPRRRAAPLGETAA